MTAELIARMSKEDAGRLEKEQAFEELVVRYQDMAYGLAYSMLGDAHLAQDAAQEAFLTVWRELDQLREPEAFPGWFRRIVMSQVHRLTRRKTYHTVVLEDTVQAMDAEADPEQAAERNDMAGQVRLAVAELPDAERHMVVLFYISDLSYQSIADMLEVPVATVKKKLYNARQKLGERLLLLVKDQLHPLKPSRDDKFRNIVRQLVATGCSSKQKRNQLEITLESNGGYVSTQHFYKVPLRVSVTAKTDSTNLRLRFAKSEVILNWGPNPDELRWVDPATGTPQGIPGQGRIPVDEWVKVDWIIEPAYAVLLVNGEERFRSEGEYGRLAGQIGVGAANRSKVTVKSFEVQGDTCDSGYPIVAPPRYECDGAMIHVEWDKHDQAVQWFVEHMGWSHVGDGAKRQTDDTQDERMTALGIPRFGIIWIKSAKVDNPRHHLYAPSGMADPHLRLCFNTRDIVHAHGLFRAKRVRVTELYRGPGGKLFFDFWATDESIRLTACGDERNTRDECLFSPCEWHRIGVTDLSRSVSWYRQFLGFEVVEEFREEGWILMTSRTSFYSVGFSEIWLEQLPANASTDPSDYPVRPYFHLRKLVEEYDRLVQGGVTVSPIAGKPPIEGYSMFHFYDPDGNRFNVWYY